MDEKLNPSNKREFLDKEISPQITDTMHKIEAGFMDNEGEAWQRIGVLEDPGYGLLMIHHDNERPLTDPDSYQIRRIQLDPVSGEMVSRGSDWLDKQQVMQLSDGTIAITARGPMMVQPEIGEQRASKMANFINKNLELSAKQRHIIASGGEVPNDQYVNPQAFMENYQLFIDGDGRFYLRDRTGRLVYELPELELPEYESSNGRVRKMGAAATTGSYMTAA